MKIVVKIGGTALEDKATLQKCARAVVELAKDGHHIALVHGGGTTLTRTLALLGKKSDFVNGLLAIRYPIVPGIDAPPFQLPAIEFTWRILFGTAVTAGIALCFRTIPAAERGARSLVN